MSIWNRRFGAALAGLLLAGTAAQAQTPTKITLGYGPASDVTLTLIRLKPELAVHQGKSYQLELQEFRGNDMRFRAYLARTLDGATASSNAVVDAAAKGIDLVIVGSISKESSQGFSTSYMVKEDSPVKSAADLKGKLIGINAFHSSIELWAKLALKGAGLDPEKDVRVAVVEFPVQGQALRSDQITLGAFPQPFAALEEQKGGVRTIFTARDVVPFDQETQLLFMRRAVLEKSPQAVRDLLSDLAAATRFYIEKPAEARKLLLEAGVIKMPEQVYLGMKDYYRDPTLKVDVESMRKMLALQKSVGGNESSVDFSKIVDMGYLPK
jgi:ABC-type nitrate/sulfonate/bicarbonate transport system substrate-binding protein